MPNFGADPDAPHTEWETPKSRYVSKPVSELTRYFTYHRHMKMSQRCNEEDKTILNVFFSRRLKQGVPSDNLKQLVDRFFQHPAGEHEFPARMFCKTEVQQDLADDILVRSRDPIIQWLVEGMPTDDFIFDQPRDTRKSVLLNCDESIMRYPEVVAEILRRDYREPWNTDLLVALETLVCWNLGKLDADPRQALEALCKISLPRELGTERPSPSAVRPRQNTVLEAVLAIPVAKKKEDW